MRKETDEEKLKVELSSFTGTEYYYRHFTGLKFTDGIKYLADKTDCYWLIDLIGSYQNLLKEIPFQVWTVKVNKGGYAVVTCREDTNEPVIVKQEIEYTDFPLSEFECYCIDGVLILKSEY